MAPGVRIFARSIHSMPNSEQLLYATPPARMDLSFASRLVKKAAHGQDVKILNASKEMDVPMIKMDVPMFTPLPMLTVEKVRLHFNPHSNP